MPSEQLTFTIAASGDDGEAVGQFNFTYPPPSATGTDSDDPNFATRKTLLGITFDVRTGLLRWDTSAIPDYATVTAATLRVWCLSKSDADGRSLLAEWYTHDGSIGFDDWTSTEASDAHSGTALASITTGAYNNFTLQNLENINKSGYSGLRTHISGGQPVGNNFVAFETIEGGVHNPPQLIVTFDTNEQEARPVATDTAGAWTAEPSGTLHANTADDDDATFAELDDGSDPSTMILDLDTLLEPVAGDGSLTIRARRID